MKPDEIEHLRRQYTDRYVVVKADRPRLARFRGVVGQVKTINCNGRALVQFNTDNDRGWYDLEIDDLEVVERPT